MPQKRKEPVRDLVTISKISLKVVPKDKDIVELDIMVPIQGGVINAIYYENYIHLWVEHSLSAQKTAGTLKIIPANVVWQYDSNCQLVATFIKNLETYGVYITTL